MLPCIASCLIFEAVIQKLRRVPVTVTDGSAAVTGMLLAFVLPPDVPLWIPVVGALIAVGLAKQLFGGLGCNIWNPALVARAVLSSLSPISSTARSGPSSAAWATVSSGSASS